MKKYKWTVILSCLVTLLPMVVGLVLWSLLPEQMAIHWNFHGQADGFGGKLFVIVGLPLILLVGQLVCVFFSLKDAGNKEQNKKVINMVLWIIPFVSLLCHGMVYAVAFGKPFDAMMLTYLLMGAMFIFIGNYLPKCKQNRTIGIKIKWTFESEENWNATHRWAGKLWVIGGLALLPCAFLPAKAGPWVMFSVIAVMVIAPMIYSYRYAKRNPADEAEKKQNALSKTAKIITAALVGTVLALTAVLMCTGSLRYRFEKDTFTVEASYWADYELSYERIETVQYRKDFSRGTRTYGFGSAKLSLGHFQNEEFSDYLCYAYTACDDAVIVKTKNSTLVLNGKNETETKQIYEALLSRLPE